MIVVSDESDKELIPGVQKVTLTRWEDGLWGWEDAGGGATQFNTAEDALKHYFVCRAQK